MQLFTHGLLIVLAVAAAHDAPGAPLPDGASARLGTPRPKDDRPIVDLAIAPDGRWIAVVRMDQTVELWDGRSRTRRSNFEVPSGKYRAVAFSADGKQLTAIGAYGEQTATVWDTDSGKPLGRLRSTTGVVSGLSPDGNRIVLTGKNTVRLIDCTTEQVRVQFAGPNLVTGTFPARELAFSPDGRRLAAVDEAAQSGVQLMLTDSVNVNGSDMWKRVPVSAALRAAPVAQWDLMTGKALPRLERAANRLRRLTYAPDGRTIAALSFARTSGTLSTIHCWEAATGKLCGQIAWRDSPLNGVAIAPDGRRLAAGAIDGTIHVWDLATGQHLASRRGHRGIVWVLRFASDGRTLYTGGNDGTVLIWDMTQIRAPAMAPSRAPDACVADLAGTDAAKAYRAIWALAAAPKQAVPLLRGRFRFGTLPDAAQARHWIADLDSDDYDTRQSAFRRLCRFSPFVAPTAKVTLDGNVPLELRRRLQQVLAAPPDELPIADVRAMHTLELIATTEARAVLDALAQGLAGTGPMREARESLDRLVKRAAHDSTSAKK